MVASKNSLPASATDRYFGIAEDGNLNVWDVNGKSSSITALGNSPSSNRTVRLFDSGNLVLIDDLSRNVLWQSFDNPGVTFLPGGRDLYAHTATSDIRSTSRNCEPCGTNIIPYPLSTGSNCGDPDYSSTNTGITDNLLQGRGEIEIEWDAPLEPACNSSSDCKDWPNSSCNETKRCHCNGNFYWSDSSLNCSQGSELINPMQNREPGPKGTSLSLQAVVISVIVIVAVLLLCVISYITYERRMAARGQDSSQLEEDDKKGIDLPFFELEIILAATNNFSDAYKLGQGGFGPVYKGMFPRGQEVAVKRLSIHSGQGLVEFKNEVVLIAKLQHRNLVRLLGYCIEGDEKILLYEYKPNKSLNAFIFG
ncbi:hypothetical protein F0562_010950 [Nyssa sinensis]|uniref:Protein kinase domain-containing protein n=1 Tax=Nyssa sinensis TaxID=561372 RepID=A0A5J5A5C8_9ASTE|nr:hypothetical protein F0562_010950 [Nyssa sinensis]